ncbi:MAG: cell division protein FtsA, partial [Agathobacter sp.]|nr:cell division protein FtsA [Agathobacter sp.]
VYTISQLDEFTNSTVGFVVNGKMVTCPKFVQVNGSLEPGSYQIQEGDVIETRNFYTVGQVAEFMDVEVDTEHEILVNNREADFDTLVYENFSIEWTVLSFGVADAPYEPKPVQEAKIPTGMNLPEGVENLSGDAEGAYSTETSYADGLDATEGYKAPCYEATSVPAKEPAPQEDKGIVVFVNGEPVPLTGKDEFIFVDIFDRITFDLTQSRGRAIATLVNGREAQFTEVLSHGDKVELYWKEN